MDMLRVTAEWTGFSGGPGYSNFFFSVDAGFWDGGLFGDDAQLAATTASQRVADAFLEIQQLVPSDINIVPSSEVAIMDSDTGEIQGTVTRDEVQVGNPQGSGGYSAVSGAVVNWNTNDYRFGRRIRGRTFLVPLVASAYQDDGTITTSALGSLRAFGAEMVGDAGGPEFGVWSRPRDGAGGVFATVVAATVPDMAAVLRSRRD